jgi:GR25 family glycosyltransferase involved in LPS biosynthesis
MEPIYCINLDRRVDRWRRMAARLRNRALRAERFAAIDGRALEQNGELAALSRNLVVSEFDTSDNARWDASVRPGRRARLSAGGLGCALSHLAVWDDLLRRRRSAALVIEDDVDFARGFVGRLAALRARLPRRWDLAYLGYVNTGPAPTPLADGLGIPRHLFGTFGYLISQRGARRLLERLPIDEPIDNFLAKQFASLEVVCAVPPLVVPQAASWRDSDVLHSARHA